MPIADLVGVTDSDLAGWLAGTQATYLEMACKEVRKYCGWHIAPAVPVTAKRCYVGSYGLVVLRSTYIGTISAITVGDTDPQTLTADTDYSWEQPQAWLRLHPQSVQIPCTTPWTEPHVFVSYVSGYDECPADVKAVIFEVMATAMELPASNLDRVQTMQYSGQIVPDVGIALSGQQKDRLSSYRLRGFGGRLRP
jgi:hypothetical protein